MRILKSVFLIILVYLNVFIILMGSGEIKIFDVFWIGTLIILISGLIFYFKKKSKDKNNDF